MALFETRADVDTVVPGHGSVTDLGGIRDTLDYLSVLTDEAQARYDAGMSVDEAARDIALDAWRGWLDPERIWVNVHTLYRDFSGDGRAPHALEMFAGMGRLTRDWS